jgi:FkbM family methyltransferase
MQRVKDRIRNALPQFMKNMLEERYYYRYGEVELHLLPYLCDPHKEAIDVGANYGCYTAAMRHHAAYVTAVEPLPELAKLLRRKYHGVEVHQGALSDRDGMVQLHIPIYDDVNVIGLATIDNTAALTYGKTRTIDVTTMTLDSLGRTNVGFIKVDVEGHEQAVLDGAVRTIERCQPRMLVELVEELTPGCVSTAYQFFKRLRYSGWFVCDGRLEPIDNWKMDYQRLENKPDMKAPLSARKRFDNYLYNFIFLPPKEQPETVALMCSTLRQLR